MERTVQTVRALKIVLPILFVSFVIVIYAFYSERVADSGTVTTDSARPERQGERPRLISYEFEDTQTVGDRVISRIRAEKTAGFDSGWYTLDNVELDIFREDGSVYTMSAPSAEFNSESKEARAEGGVIVTSRDGLDLRTESITFDGRRLSNRIPVRVKMNQWSGTARGADLDVERETLRLEEGVDFSFAGEGPESIDLTSRTALFEHSNGSVRFEGDVRLIRTGDRYESDFMMMQVDQNREKLIALEGSGNVTLAVAPGSALAPRGGEGMNGAKRITSDRFVGQFDGDGEITAIQLYSDSGLVMAELLGPVRRTIKSSSAKLNLSGGEAESVELFGTVTLEEESELRRTMGAERLVMTFDQQTGDATSAVFDGNILYRDIDNEARAERMFYDVAGDIVRLSAVPGSAPTISAGPQRISADEIIVEPGGRALRASGRVITRIINAAGSDTIGESALFPDDRGAIFVNSDALAIRELEGFAAFSGNVRAWQGENTLFANELQITSNGEIIHAKGRVRTILHNTGQAADQPVKSRSERMEARRADNRIELFDDVVVENAGRSLMADRALFIFGSNQELERVEAIGHLKLTEPANGRSGSGEKATFEVASETILIEGSPAEMREPRGTIRGTQIVLDMKRNRVDVLRGDSPTEATYNAEPGA